MPATAFKKEPGLNCEIAAKINVEHHPGIETGAPGIDIPGVEEF